MMASILCINLRLSGLAQDDKTRFFSYCFLNCNFLFHSQPLYIEHNLLQYNE